MEKSKEEILSEVFKRDTPEIHHANVLFDLILEAMEEYRSQPTEQQEQAIKLLQAHAEGEQTAVRRLKNIIEELRDKITEQAQEIEKLKEEIKKQQYPADLRYTLLTHPDKKMVKASCLHYLGDDRQSAEQRITELEAQLNEARKILSQYNTGEDEAIVRFLESSPKQPEQKEEL